MLTSAPPNSFSPLLSKVEPKNPEIEIGKLIAKEEILLENLRQLREKEARLSSYLASLRALSSTTHYVSLWGFRSKNPLEISTESGEILELVETISDNWVVVRNFLGKEGVVARNYVRPVPLREGLASCVPSTSSRAPPPARPQVPQVPPRRKSVVDDIFGTKKGPSSPKVSSSPKGPTSPGKSTPKTPTSPKVLNRIPTKMVAKHEANLASFSQNWSSSSALVRTSQQKAKDEEKEREKEREREREGKEGKKGGVGAVSFVEHGQDEGGEEKGGLEGCSFAKFFEWASLSTRFLLLSSPRLSSEPLFAFCSSCTSSFEKKWEPPFYLRSILDVKCALFH